MVVVLGAGPIGLAVTAAAAALGAVTIVVEPSNERRAAAGIMTMRAAVSRFGTLTASSRSERRRAARLLGVPGRAGAGGIDDAV